MEAKAVGMLGIEALRMLLIQNSKQIQFLWMNQQIRIVYNALDQKSKFANDCDRIDNSKRAVYYSNNLTFDLRVRLQMDMQGMRELASSMGIKKVLDMLMEERDIGLRSVR